MATKSTKRKTTTGKKAPTRASAAKTAVKKAAAKKSPASKKKPAAGKSPTKTAGASKIRANNAAAKKTASKKAAARKTPEKKSASNRPPAAMRATLKKGREGSDENRFRPFGELLVKKQDELMQAYAIAKTDPRDRLDDGTEDYIDYAVNSYAKDFMLSLTELERQQLQLVREAIHRLNRGEYGECLQCGVEIPTKRLEVAPWVRYCIQCQELEDQGLLPEIPTLALDDDEADLEDAVEDEEEDEDDDEDVADDEDVLVTDVDNDDSEE